MYQYDRFDHALVADRVTQFRDQVARRVAGELSEDEFRHLRLRNGLYMQLHAYMLRVAIPYGVFSSRQMRMLAHIARTYDKSYGHFTTRQNIQFNWPRLEDVPDILADLASVEMNAIQTSGNANRNVTSDPFAGVAGDETADARPYCELIRQFVTLHPEFSFLPRKFKIALSAGEEDRAAVHVHDIGLRLGRNEAGELGFRVLVGGGLGRTPFIAKELRAFLPEEDLLTYLQAILRVYNLEGRRDNMYKARIKILVHELGIERFRDLVEREFEDATGEADQAGGRELDRLRALFAPPDYKSDEKTVESGQAAAEKAAAADPAFADWRARNVVAHRQLGYAIAVISLKPAGGTAGDVTADQMDALADLADAYSFGELRATHRQNLVLPDVAQEDLFGLWEKLVDIGLATANLGWISDIICCPGMDYCALATARSIPIAQRISRRFVALSRQHDIGDLHINISGCINACGHHHVGNIGILGVDKNGEEYYQVTLGGSSGLDADIGRIIGPAFAYEKIVDAVETVVDTYLRIRQSGEKFLDTYRRAGAEPFKEALYGID